MDLPDGWTAVVAEGPGPFVTRARLRRPDGSIVSWRSRAHRKGPGRLAEWMSGLFAAGSVCFAAGAIASQWGSSALEAAIGVTFFVGSLNVSTFSALKHGLDTRQTNLRVWTPDVAGSVCFLVASVLAYAEVCGRWLCWRVRSVPWWITSVNLLGSVWFGLAAIGAVIEPNTNEPLAARLDNVGTALGAICFLVGALLLVPEARHASAQPVTA